MLFIFPFLQLFNLYSSFSSLLHIMTILSLMSNWHLYFLATSSLFSASRSVTLSHCLLHVAFSLVVQDVINTGLYKPWEHCHILCFPQTVLKDVANYASHIVHHNKFQCIIFVAVDMIKLAKPQFLIVVRVNSFRLLL